MKIFQNKSIFKKLIIVLLVIMLFSFCMPKTVRAEDEGIGGKLLKPIISLILSLGDGVYDIVHKVILQQDITLIHIDFSDSVWETILTVAVFIIVAVVAVVAVVATAGAIAALIPALASIVSVGLGTVLVVGVGTGYVAATLFNAAAFPDDELVLPLYSISPEEIFSNKLVIFDVDFFDPDPDVTYKDKNGDVVYDDNGNPVVLESTAGKLKGVISNWYIILRDISLIALLSVLVYIGIRIIISSTSNDKAKYKQMLIDWIVAICLLFTMQYIMSFSNILVEKVTDVLTGINYENDSLQILPDKDGKLTKRLQEDYDYTDEQMEALYVKDGEGNYVKNEDGDKQIYWHANLIGLARLNAQMGEKESAAYAGYTLIFLVLVCFTVIFIWTYLKRVIYMAFLTLIAPLVALTYPIDKLNDGKAQAFNMWFKEYIFNLLVQPMHLLLYTILVTSAFELASQNIIYSLVALGFMIPAEKLLRKFFGFEKAQTPGLLAGPAGAALMMNGMSRLLGKSPKGGKASINGSGKTNSNKEENSSIKIKDDLPDENMDSLNMKNNEATLGKGTAYEENSDSSNGSKGLNQTDMKNKGINTSEGPFIEDKIKNFGEFLINDTQFGLGAQNMLYKGSQLGKKVKNNKYVAGATRKLKNIPNRSRIARAGIEASRYYARGMKNKLSNKIKNGHPVKSAIKTAGGIATGTAAASLGLAAGIVSGDPSKAAQYIATGALGGYKFGGEIVNGVSNAVNVEGTKATFERAYYGEEEYKERQIQKNIREAQKDVEIQNILEKRLGSREKAKEAIKNVVPDCVRYGVTEADDIAAVAKLQEMGIEKNKAIRTAISVNEYGKNTSKIGAKDSEDLDKTLINRVKKNKNVKEENVEQVAKDTRELMDMYSDIKYKI